MSSARVDYGPSSSMAESPKKYTPYIPVTLDFLCLKYVDIKRATFEQILCRSAASLRVLHIEHVTTLEMVPLGTVVSKLCCPSFD